MGQAEREATTKLAKWPTNKCGGKNADLWHHILIMIYLIPIGRALAEFVNQVEDFFNTTLRLRIPTRSD